MCRHLDTRAHEPTMCLFLSHNSEGSHEDLRESWKCSSTWCQRSRKPTAGAVDAGALAFCGESSAVEPRGSGAPATTVHDDGRRPSTPDGTTTDLPPSPSRGLDRSAARLHALGTCVLLGVLFLLLSVRAKLTNNINNPPFATEPTAAATMEDALLLRHQQPIQLAATAPDKLLLVRGRGTADAPRPNPRRRGRAAACLVQ